MILDIIGISGKAAVGKDHVGRAILHPLGFRKWSFAAPMKNELFARGGATYEEVHRTKPPAVRAALQRIGTEEGWHVHGRGYWLRHAEGWLRFLEEEWGQTRFYFTDVRFPHEVEWIRSLGGRVIRLEHGSRRYPLAGTPNAEHESETALDGWTDWDCRIINGERVTTEQIRHVLQSEGIIPDPSGMRQFFHALIP